MSLWKSFLKTFNAFLTPQTHDILQETYVMDKDGYIIPLTKDMENYNGKITITTTKQLLNQLQDYKNE